MKQLHAILSKTLQCTRGRDLAWFAGLFWLQAGQTSTVAGVQNLRGLLFFELMFMAMRAMLGALFTFPSEFKMMLKVGFAFLLGCCLDPFLPFPPEINMMLKVCCDHLDCSR